MVCKKYISEEDDNQVQNTSIMFLKKNELSKKFNKHAGLTFFVPKVTLVVGRFCLRKVVMVVETSRKTLYISFRTPTSLHRLIFLPLFDAVIIGLKN